MYIDKQTSARLLINASIRNVFNSECPVANHLTAMSARQILHEYAAVHGVTLVHDMRAYLKDKALAKKFEYLWKTKYNFFKHADNDYNDEVNITNIAVLNEFETLFNIEKYAQLFNERTGHMALFLLYLVMLYPDKFQPNEDQARAISSARGSLQTVGSLSRVPLRELFAFGLTQQPDTRAELDQAKQLSIQEPTEIPDAEKENFKRRKSSE
ncbi:MAG: hypothetical protein K2X43_05155 [Hyphomonadaceae bacterium]|jgi:hypothetical protein|nr:hypothetical protein [Hyphomonadaceae bacterium]